MIETKEVVHRNAIYTSATSPPVVASDVMLELIKEFEGPFMDFGCGSGVYVKRLREDGMEARGIDLNIEWIKSNIIPGVEEYVELYDGTFPTKYSDNSFNTVICIEALEHIEEYEKWAMIIVSAIGSGSGHEQVFLMFWLRPFFGWSSWHV